MAGFQEAVPSRAPGQQGSSEAAVERRRTFHAFRSVELEVVDTLSRIAEEGPTAARLFEDLDHKVGPGADDVLQLVHKHVPILGQEGARVVSVLEALRRALDTAVVAESGPRPFRLDLREKPRGERVKGICPGPRGSSTLGAHPPPGFTHRRSTERQQEKFRSGDHIPVIQDFSAISSAG